MTIGKDVRGEKLNGENTCEQGVIATPNHCFQPKMFIEKWNLNLHHYICFLFLWLSDYV